MTHAPPSDAGPPSSRPARLSLDDDAWRRIGHEFMAGASGPELAARYRVSVTSFHRHMKRLGFLKRAGGTALALAHADAALAEEARARALRWSADEIAELAVERPHDPARLATLAITLSGNAMLSGRLGEARALTELAVIYDRLAVNPAETWGAAQVRLAFDRDATDYLFDDDAEQPLDPDAREMYWRWRDQEIAEEEARAQADAAKDARIVELEGEVREMRALFKAPEEALAGCWELPQGGAVEEGGEG